MDTSSKDYTGGLALHTVQFPPKGIGPPETAISGFTPVTCKQNPGSCAPP